MKKKLIFILIIVFVILILFVTLETIFQKFEVYDVQVVQKPNEFIDTGTLVRDADISVVIRGFYTGNMSKQQIEEDLYLDDETANYVMKFAENSNNNIFIKTDSSKRGIEILNPDFDYCVYDNNGNIITTSITNGKNSFKNNKFIKYFMKNVHNSNEVKDYEKYVCCGESLHTSVKNIPESTLTLISSSADYSKLDLSKIHVLIINPSYEIENRRNRIYCNNTIYNFIIENE